MPATSRPSAGVRIEAVRVNGFRALRDVCVVLDPGTTVLVGENNAGKSAFLDALATAFGTRSAVPEDLHVDADDRRPEAFLIDFLLVPTVGDAFEPRLEALFGDAVRRERSEDDLGEERRQFVAIRTIGTIGADRSIVDRRRCFIDGWSDCDGPSSSAVAEIPGQRVTERHLALISLTLLHASRDLVAEMRRRTSRWGRLLAQRDLAQDIEKQVEDQLRDLGELVLGKSPVLGRLRHRLDEVQQAMPTVEQVELEPLPTRISDLHRATDVVVKAPKGPRLPLRLQGLGSRSLAELMVYRAFAAELPGTEERFSPHLVACFEEPEAHLHPHAQFAVMGIIDQVPGQRIVTTHSPQIAGTANLGQIRLFRHSESGIEVGRSGDLGEEEQIKTRRLLDRSYGQVFFARLIIIGDGTTEHAALPVFARARWGVEPESLGVTFVDPGGLAAANFLIKALEGLGIPWLALVDGDKGGSGALRAISNQVGRTVDQHSQEVVMLPAGADLERYLVDERLHVGIKQGIADLYGSDALAKFSRRRKHLSLSEDEILEEFLDKNKGTYGAAVAEAIVTAPNENGAPTIPERIEELLSRADRILGMNPP
ncbi:MAG: AAA family ATPase [bacterium]|nr:AAA family ATPase [bacterium]